MNHMKERGEREEPQEEKEEGKESFEAFKARRGDTPRAWWEWGLSDLRKEMTANMGELRRELTANMGELRREMDERSRSTNRIMITMWVTIIIAILSGILTMVFKM